MTLKYIKLVPSARVVHILFVLSLAHCQYFSFLWFRVKQTNGIMKFAFFGRVRKIAKSDNRLRRVCLSVRMEQLGS
jgi:hypothetical protein